MEREDELFFAELALQAGRCDDVVRSLKKVFELDANLSNDERILLEELYKNIVNARHLSLRVIQDAEQREEHRVEGETKCLKRIREYRAKVEAEQKAICDECINLIDTFLIRPSNPPEAAAFNKRMKGDFYRYLAEIKVGAEMQNFAEESKKAYEDAQDIAKGHLPPANPVRLSVALNFSVLHRTIYNDIKRACDIAKAAYVLAEPYMDTLSQDGKTMMSGLRENYSDWANEASFCSGKQRADPVISMKPVREY